jgi:hypothetical protein
MSEEQQRATSALAKPPSERISRQGTRFDAATLLDFIRSGLRHEAVRDEVNQQLRDHVDGKITTAELTEKLRPIVVEALATAADVDWFQVARELIADAESNLGRSWPVLLEEDRWLIDAMEDQLRSPTQDAQHLRSRARELRAEAGRSDLRAMRDTALVLADRYERAAETLRTSSEPQ